MFAYHVNYQKGRRTATQAARKLAAFGEFLQTAREHCAPSQQEAVKILAQAGLKVSKSWVAQLETGRFTDPDTATLLKLARAYNLDSDQLMYALVRDKYGLDDLSVVSPLSRERWRAIAGLLQPSSAVGRVEGLELDQLRAKTEVLKEEILDRDGLARWQTEFKELKELWIVAPQFRDDKDATLREAVIHNLRRGVRFFYFVRKADLEEGRPFWLFLHRLGQDHTSLRDRIKKQIRGVGLDEPELRWLAADIVIANPSDPATRTGFAGIRENGALKFASRMPDFDAESVVHGIMPFLAKRLGREVLNLR